MIKKVLFISMMAASVGGIAVPAAATIYVQVGPPEMRVEAVPAPRHGYVWAPGYWNYRGNQHVWAKGTWVRERPGYAYHSPKWVEHDGRWSQERAHWARHDRDGDGVPDSMDHQPDNPRRN
jgi:hypothetical protein